MWKARPVFISSTFLDMQSERDYLLTRVFPELEERLRERRQHLEWVDLRVGVATASIKEEAEREVHVLKVCLGEAARCRPFLIILIGDRYGYTPAAELAQGAAREAGLATDPTGRSVTDLEIEVGLLAARAGQFRSYAYFRELLPYKDMPRDIAAQYSDTVGANKDQATRLEELKRRLKRLMGRRARNYRAAWDETNGKVIGLEEWGRMVLSDLWSELDAETKATRNAVEPTWSEIERSALADFAEDRARNFVGRKDTIARLMQLAASPAGRADPTGVCITGEAGSGKSALFGELHRRLQGGDAFVLAHAASASVLAPSVDSMLRRWIEELANGLGIIPQLPEDANANAIEDRFSSLIEQMARRRRVVVLVDALDQFEPTPRGRFATWLPTPWPANARLIVTAIAGEGSGDLSRRPGMSALALPPLDAGDARGLIEAICDRYHRTLEPEVVDALVAKAAPNGPARGNPLWLVLAAEELNLLDGDDFARAHRQYTGEPGERLRALVLDVIASLPANAVDLYDRTFARAEELFGAAFARAFLGLLGASRGGWRDHDFRSLLPAASGKPWDELRFAQLRRLFRGQLRRRGPFGQLDVNHAQMRVAARARLAAQGQSEPALHSVIADYLLMLPPDDPLRESETMVHLLASEAWTRAAYYYGGDLSPGELTGSSRALVDAALQPAQPGAAGGVARVLNLLRAAGGDIAYQEYAAQRLLYNVFDALNDRAALEVQEELIRGIARYFDGLIAPTQDLETRARVHRAASHGRLGNVQAAQGRTNEAIESYREAGALAEALVRDHPKALEWRRDQSVGFNHLGKALLAQGRVDAALESFQRGLALIQRVADAQPTVTEWRCDLSITNTNIGDAQLARGDVAAAEASYGAALSLAKRLIEERPDDPSFVFLGSIPHGRLAKLHLSRGDLASAEKACRSEIAIVENLTSTNPENATWRFALFAAHQHLGLVQSKRDALAAAETAFIRAHEIIEGLTTRDPSNAGWQVGLMRTLLMLAEVRLARKNHAAAVSAGRSALRIAESLSARASDAQTHEDDLATCHIMLGRAQEEGGDLSGAELSYKTGLTIAERMAIDDPECVAARSRLALACKFCADIRRARGDSADAEALVLTAISALNEAVLRQPWRLDHQNNLTACHVDLAQVRIQRGDLAGAEAAQAAAVESARRMSEIAPNDATLLSNLAGCYHSLQKLQAKRGDLQAAQTTLRALRDVEQRMNELG